MGPLTPLPRRECKYLVPHRTAAAFTARIADACVPDPHSGPEGYLVNSVYYDSDSFDSYHEKIDGVDPRFKVRARFYGAWGAGGCEPDSPVFLEVKRRVGDRIHKLRTRYTHSRWPAGSLQAPLHLPERRLQGVPSDRDPSGFVNRRPLYPVCRVTYGRVAFVSRLKPSLRVTIDTNLRASGPAAYPGGRPEDGRVFLPSGIAVLEIKLPCAMPSWLAESCAGLGLEERRYSKYCSAVEALYPSIAFRSLQMGR
ncbi:MAG: hypothetical protein A2X36_16740 [Elusimicrobia bacterium GWA2_69_24]|nr:MAG: hypothetical protein A2X36_16740 [Elusimicrobia bacterium GWA2_69_24]